jgi:Tfp pilus assembly PilM family ATPase
MGLSCYLILIGIYYSAVSVAQDSKLRQSVRKFAINESRLLDNVGTAQMEQEIVRRVVPMVKEHQHSITEDTGIESSLSEQDVKQYLEQVIEEIRNRSNAADSAA